MTAWPTVPLWSVAQRVDRINRPDAELLSVYRDWGVIRKADRDDNFNKPSDDLSTYKYVEQGDLVLNKMKTWQGSLGVSPYEGIVSPAYFVCSVSPKVYGRFLHHLLRSHAYIAKFEASSKGIRTNQWDLSYDELRKIPVLLPSLEEQRRIADFLDDRVDRIDQIIAARRSQIELLMNASRARLQDLQDEWSAKHGSTRLGRTLRGLEQGWSPQAEAVPAALDEWGVMRAGCVNGGVFREDDNKRLPDGLEPETRYEIRPGDLLMSRASGSLDLIGSVAVVPSSVRGRLLLCDKVYRLSPDVGWSSSFLATTLRSHKNRELIRLGVSGAEGMANNLPSGVIRGLVVPNVPLGQQEVSTSIASEVESEARSGAAWLAASVGLLGECKQSLITAAVTGEIDVTTAGSGIPG